MLEMRYVNADLEYHQQASIGAREQFMKDFETYCDGKGLLTPLQAARARADGKLDFDDIEEEEALSAPTPDEDPEARKRVSKMVNDLFKKIAVRTHPDKLSKLTDPEEVEELKALFIEAKEASNNREWFKLQSIAMDLGIKLPNPTKEHVLMVEEKIREVKKTIRSIQSTYAWHYQNNRHDAEKIFAHYMTLVKCVPKSELNSN